MVILDRTAAALCSSSCFFRAWTVHVTSHVHPIQSAPSSSFPDHVTIISEKKSSADGGDSDCDDNDDGNGDDDDDGNDDDAASLPASHLSHNPMNSPPPVSREQSTILTVTTSSLRLLRRTARGGEREEGNNPRNFFLALQCPTMLAAGAARGGARERETLTARCDEREREREKRCPRFFALFLPVPSPSSCAPNWGMEERGGGGYHVHTRTHYYVRAPCLEWYLMNLLCVLEKVEARFSGLVQKNRCPLLNCIAN